MCALLEKGGWRFGWGKWGLGTELGSSEEPSPAGEV